jgi:hypothetical protein
MGKCIRYDNNGRSLNETGEVSKGAGGVSDMIIGAKNIAANIGEGLQDFPK